MNGWTDATIIEHIRARLKETRFQHSLNVAQSAKELAEIYGADPAKCYTAGLLHDITKNAPEEEHLALFALGGVTLSETERRNKKLWHAMSGAVYVQYKMGIADPETVLAVRYHTTGRAGMTLTERVIYIADFVSAERQYPDVDIMRALAAENLEKAALYTLRFTLPDLIRKGQTVHRDSLDLYNELILKG